MSIYTLIIAQAVPKLQIDKQILLYHGDKF